MSPALSATSQSLVKALSTRLGAELPALFGAVGGGGGVAYQVLLSKPDQMQNDGVEGLAVWLYLVERDAERLNAPNDRVSDIHIRNHPLPVRAHYLMTPVVTKSGTISEQEILETVLRTFHDHRLLRGTDLAGDLAGTSTELTVHLETLGLDALTKIWDAANGWYDLSVSYEVSGIDVVSRVGLFDGPPVLQPLPSYGVAALVEP